MPEKIHVYKIGDDFGLWWAGRTKEEAYADYLKSGHAGCVEPEIPLSEVVELSDKDMAEMDFYDDPASQETPSRTFAEELQRLVDANESFPRFFAIEEP